MRWPLVLTGMPPGVAEDVLPLLVFLDRSRVPYDLTSDLALMLGEGPSASDRPGVLLAGAQRWVTAGYARRLRRYVVEGGRLASVGTESLRRGVVVARPAAEAPGRLRRPTQPIDRDPFGARLRPLRRLPPRTELRPITGTSDAPLLSFWDGTLSGFGWAEESLPPAAADRIRVIAGVGVEPAPEGEDANADPDAALPEARPVLTQTRLGKGLAIRIGLLGWAQRLGVDAEVRQLTRNAVDVVRGERPKPRDLR